jgi:hypothetical protein
LSDRVVLEVLEGGNKHQADIDHAVLTHGVRKLKVMPGTWVQRRNGNGLIHAVYAYHFHRDYGLHDERQRGRQDDQNIHNATVEYVCRGRGYDAQLMQVCDPIAQDQDKVCKRCLAKIMVPPQ